MNCIIIEELEVFYRVGVPAAERAKPQRLLVSIEMTKDFTEAAKTDDISKTIDYHAVSIKVVAFGRRRSWKLIETLSVNLAEMILREFNPLRVKVCIKKFILPETKYVAVSVVRPVV